MKTGFSGRAFGLFLLVAFFIQQPTSSVFAKIAATNRTNDIPVEPILDPPSTIGQYAFTITWASVPDAADYLLDISTDGFVTFFGGYENFSIGNVVSFDVTGLSPGTTYECRLRATNVDGDSGYSNIITALTIPETPTGLVINNISSSGFDLSWNSVTGFDNFFIDLSSDNFSTYVENNLNVTGPTSYSFTGLSSGTIYQVRIRSANESGSSPSSLIESQITLCSAPVLGIPSEITQTTGNISWNAVEGVIDYALDVSTDGFGTFVNGYEALLVGDATSYDITGLAEGTTYSIRLRAVNTAGTSVNSDIRTMLTIPLTPTGLAPTSITPTGFTLNWDAIGGATNFFYDLSTDGFVTFVFNNVSAAGPISKNFNGLLNETEYQIRLRSANSSGSSPNSVTLDVSTFATPPTAAPTALVFSTITTSSFDVSFTEASGSPNYLVLRQVEATPSESPVDGTAYPVGTTFGSSDVVYSGNGTSFSETSLLAGTHYYYKIFSFNGTGATANYRLGTTLTGSHFTICDAPVLNSLSGIAQTSATILWDAVTGATNYAIDVSLDEFDTYVSGFENHLTGNITSFNITGLAAGVTYSIRLRTVNAAGQSDNSNVQTMITIPPTPTGVVTSEITSTGFTVSWNGVSSATGFYVDLSTDNFASYVIDNLLVPGPTTYTFTGLSSATAYKARVRSANITGSSLNSATIIATTIFAEPIGQPSSINFSAINATGFAVVFTSAVNSPDYLVLRREGAAPTEIPVDGVSYTTGSTLGSSKIANVGNAIGFTETLLNASITYYYSIFSFNGSAALTNYLTTSPLTGSQLTAPLAPALSGTSGITQTGGNISWSLVTGATDYALDVSTDGFSSYVSGYQNKLLGNVNTFAITGLNPSTTYQIRLRAFNSGGASYYSYLVSLLTVPATPSGLIVSMITPTGFTLSWSSVAGANNFYVDISTDLFTSFVIGNSALGTTTSHVFNTLTSATTFQVRLRSGNASGSSLNSVTLQFTTLAAEVTAGPSNLGFNSITPGSLNVLFTAAPGSPNYLVLRKQNTAPTEVPVDGTIYTAGSLIGTSQIVYIGGTAGFSEAGLTAGTTYHYSIFAFSGSGITSNFLTASPLIGSQITRCNAPVLGSALSISQTTAVISWNLVTGASDYGLDISTDNFQSFLAGFENKLLGNVLTYSITNLIPGTQYQIRLSALNASGSSVESNVIGLLTIPETPSNLSTPFITTSGFTLSWNAINGFDHFIIDISPDDFTTYTYQNVSIPGPTTFALSGLASGTNFKVRLRSANASGTSPYSTIITVTTVAVTEPLTMHIPVFESVLKNSPVVITVEVSGGSEPRTVTLQSKGIAATDFAALNIPLKSGTTSVYETAITTAMADELGAEFYISSRDASNVVVETPQHYIIYRSFDAAANIVIPFNASAFNGKSSTFQMFSVPYNLGDKSIAGMFDAELGASGPKSWRLFHYATSQYMEHPNEFNQIELGKGYWFNALQNNFQIKIGMASVFQASATESFQMSFEPGWNQIGDPYPFNVDWDEIVEANLSAGLNSLFGFENGGYIKKNVLGAWKAGFVFSDNGGVVSFPISSKTLNGGRVQQQLGKDIDKEEWLIPIMLEAGSSFAESGFGIHPESKSSKDKYDEITMPRFIEYLEMSTTHPDFFAPDFSVDVVPASTDQQWDFQIKTNTTASKGNLYWDNSALEGAASNLLLWDESNEALINMKTIGNYSFPIQNGQRIKIIFTKEGDFNPGITELGQAYPNPFNKAITVPVYLDNRNSKVEVNIYDAFGRMVQSLSQEFPNPGYYEVRWDEDKGSLSQIEDGLLFYRISINGKHSVLKRLIKQSQQ